MDYQASEIKCLLQYDGPVLIIADWQFVWNVDGVILVGHCTGTPQKSSTEAEMKSMNLMPATSWADHATNSSHIEATSVSTQLEVAKQGSVS